jgi:two-component system response regulator NreC
LARKPDLRILFFSALNSEGYIHSARLLGAAGWVVKGSIDELKAAILAVASGAPFVEPSTDHAPVILPSLTAPVIPTHGKEALTAREIEVLRLTVDSCEVKEIADRLSISVRTVEVHRAHIFKKLHTRSIARLTRYAISQGYASL